MVTLEADWSTGTLLQESRPEADSSPDLADSRSRPEVEPEEIPLLSFAWERNLIGEQKNQPHRYITKSHSGQSHNYYADNMNAQYFFA